MAVPPPVRPVTVPATPFQQHDITVQGLRLRYVDEGPGDPSREGGGGAVAGDVPPQTLVVIPGHTARLEGFDAMVPALSARHRVLVVDFPGSGYSDKPDRDYTLAFYEDVLMAFLDQLGVDRAVLLGGSLGGNLVLRLGHRFPERFTRLVAWGPAGAWKANPRLAAILRRSPRRALFWPIVYGQSRFWYAKDFPGRRAALDETFAYYREVMGPGFLAMYFGMAADQLAHSHFDHAHEITQPTLLLVGEHDDGAGMRAGVTELHGLIPANTFRIFPGARHSLETERPAELVAAILDFVDAPGSGAEVADAAAHVADAAEVAEAADLPGGLSAAVVCPPVPVVAVIAAMRSELMPVVKALGLRRVRLAGSGAEAYRGSTGRVDVVAAVTCMGTTAAREVTAAVLDEHAVDHVIVTGIAGGVDPLLRIGTLIVPERVVVDSTGEEHHPVPIDGSQASGLILTSDSLVYGDDVVADLRARDVVAVDMETGAVGEVCEARGIPWSAFRSISDRVDDVEVDYAVFEIAKPDGSPNFRKVVPYLLARPGNVPYLARLAKGSQTAITVAARATCRAIASFEFARLP